MSSTSDQIWLKYKDKFRKPDYSKYQPKLFYKPIDIEKEVEIQVQQQKQKEFEDSFPYYDDLPRMSQRQMLPTKGVAKMESFFYFGLALGYLFGKPTAQAIYGRLVSTAKIIKTRIALSSLLALSSVYFTTYAIDFQPQNSGINTPLQFEEILHNHYDLAIDAFKDTENIIYNDQKIEKKDIHQLYKIIEEKKLEMKKNQLFHQV